MGDSRASDEMMHFNFDAPSKHRNLRPLSNRDDSPVIRRAKRKRAHDPWFDVPHENHRIGSNESTELGSPDASLKSQGKRQRTSDGHKNKTATKDNGYTRHAEVKSVRGSDVHDGSRTRTKTRAHGSEPSAIAKKAAAVTTRKKPIAEVSKDVAVSQSVKGHLVSRPNSKSKKTNEAAISKVSTSTTRSVVKRAMTDIHRRSGTEVEGKDSDLLDLKELLAKHNKKFRSQHTYEPTKHAVKDVRMWEDMYDKKYYDLTPEEREQANKQIAMMVARR